MAKSCVQVLMLKGLVIRVGAKLHERFTKKNSLAGRALTSFLALMLVFGVSMSAYAVEQTDSGESGADAPKSAPKDAPGETESPRTESLFFSGNAFSEGVSQVPAEQLASDGQAGGSPDEADATTRWLWLSLLCTRWKT